MGGTSDGTTRGDVAPVEPSFDLVSNPWLPVQRLDGVVEEVSLRALFEQAGELRRLVGDVPTQEIALLRLLLAILYDALEGPAEIEDWEELWLDDRSLAPVRTYLDKHRECFQLFHPERPFFQVAGLRTAKNEIAPLSRIVADVPVGETFFSMREPGVDRLSYAEAARWLVHAHAYDTSGIKSAMLGDDTRPKNGKVYPLGVGSLGGLGGVFAEGDTLRETLLLNLIALEEAYGGETRTEDEERPAWRRPPTGPAPQPDAASRPRSLRDLYTWQTRRIRLHAEDGAVTGVVLGYGDPLALPDPHTLEPMTAFRRSWTREKTERRKPVYVPVRHDPSRSAWRGLASLLPAKSHAGEKSKKGEPAALRPPGVAEWFAKLTTMGEVFPPKKLIRLRLIGTVYGTQQAVVDEIVDDSLVLPVITLHEANPEYGAAAVDAADEAEQAVRALGQLAANLARAAGTDHESPDNSARDAAFGALDGPYRAWLSMLPDFPDLEDARHEWRTTVRYHLLQHARELLESASPAADEGRVVELPGMVKRLIDAGRAERWFHSRLAYVLKTPADQSTS